MMFPIKYNGDILSHNARVGVDGGIVESLDFVNDFSEQTKRVNIPTIVTSGLVLYLDAGQTASYPGTGTVWTDLSGNGNNATLINGPTFSSANGGSIVFDGVNDYASFQNATSLNLVTNFTVEGWILQQTSSNFATLIAKSNGSSLGWILQLRNFNLDYRFWVNFGVNTTGNGSNNGWYYARFPKNWNDGKYHHVVGIWDGLNKTVKIYVDGTPGTFNAGGAPSSESTNISNSNLPVAIGAEPDVNEFCQGNIPIARIYNRALSDAEVLQNYNATRSRFGI